MSNTANHTAYPLSWPEGWPRTVNRSPTSKFKNVTVESASSGLYRELELMGARDIVLSTNIELRLDGRPYSSRNNPGDPGVAVYFHWRKRNFVMARDEYTAVANNIRSLALAIGHLRGMERHGGGHMVERAFTGFAALPPPQVKLATPWYEVLRLPADASVSDITAAKNYYLRKYHPDTGGAEADPAKVAQIMEAAKQGYASRETGSM